MSRVGIFGLGKLGSPMLAVFAAAKHEVVGCDVSQKAVDAINDRQAPVKEPGLQEMLDRPESVYRATTDADSVARWAEILFIIVPTPSKADNTFSSDYVKKVCEDIGPAIGETDGYKLIVLTSTVMPGTMEGVVVPALEKASGKTCGDGFGLCYNPEFIALGSVIHNMLNPDFVLIGRSSSLDENILVRFFGTVFDEHNVGQSLASYRCMSFVNAELTKLVLNCYVTMKISYANEIAALCERVNGADAKVVLDAIGNDSRIGGKCLMPATKFGGPCFPRDSRALIAFGQSLAFHTMLPFATNAINNLWSQRLEAKIMALKPGTVAILGLTYKTETNVTEESAGMALLNNLSDLCSVRIFDPSVMDLEYIAVDPQTAITNISLCNTVNNCIDGADVIVIATPWPEFHGLQISHPCYVFDCWRILDPAIQAEGVVIHYPGRYEE